MKPNKPQQMLGLVPQPNLHSLRFLALTQADGIIFHKTGILRGGFDKNYNTLHLEVTGCNKDESAIFCVIPSLRLFTSKPISIS
ncbi:hypothetical protein [Nostoc sp.]|uniref:hypothetical protein n=1 Tax=Nostoc sp. TaxID=1180 RepID=UPI002FF72C0A